MLNFLKGKTFKLRNGGNFLYLKRHRASTWSLYSNFIPPILSWDVPYKSQASLRLKMFCHFVPRKAIFWYTIFFLNHIQTPLSSLRHPLNFQNSRTTRYDYWFIAVTKNFHTLFNCCLACAIQYNVNSCWSGGTF